MSCKLITNLNNSVLHFSWFVLLAACLGACSNSTTENQSGINTQAVSETSYTEPHRPQLHFSPPRQWMNDPNGMVYLNGEYHLFYQHNPDSNVWGPMHWGHAVSNDLVTWKQLPIAIFPDKLGTIFSGSAVYDEKNTSGLGTAENPPLVAIYTNHSHEKQEAGNIDYQTQSIAYSTDKGRSWQKYNGNPVLPNPGIEDFRDPKVSWHEPSNQWVMILAVKNVVHLYGSADLKSWTLLSEFGNNVGMHSGVWECPDLFPLTVNGEQKWVMLVSISPGGPDGGSATQYFIGDFNGKEFTLDPQFADRVMPDEAGKEQAVWVDYGPDNYAGVTWSNVPESDGRRLFIGWMNNWQYANQVPTEAWRSAMTVSRELMLTTVNEQVQLVTRPVNELQQLVLEGAVDTFNVITKDSVLATNLSGAPFQVTLKATDNFTVKLENGKGEFVSVGYEADSNRFFMDRRNSGKNEFSNEFPGIYYAPRISGADTVSVNLLYDVASVELFADEGLSVMTSIYFPNEPYSRLSVEIKDGEITGAAVKPMNSIWFTQTDI